MMRKPSDNPNILREMGILDKWHDKTFEDFIGDGDALLQVQKYLHNVKKARSEGVGLYIYGAYGVGKTLLLNCLLKELYFAGYKVKVITLGTLVTKFTASWYDNEERREFLKIIQTIDFLAIDDLGKEFKGSTELGLRVFDNIVRFRLQSKLPILFTANLSPNEISTYYSEGVSSMLQEMCAIIKVTGEDHRKTFHKRNKSIIK